MVSIPSGSIGDIVEQGIFFKERCKAILVDKEAYLLELSRYIVLNPVRAGLVDRPEEWHWSSYRGTAGYEPIHSCLTTTWILAQFGEDTKEARKRYQGLVWQGIEIESPLKKVEGQLYLGSKAFADEIKKLLPNEEITAEVPKAQRYLIRPSLEEVFSSPVDTSEEELMYRAWVQYNYTLQQIAEYKGVHYTTVSRKIKKFAGKKEM